ncbi:MAG: hypothetical protein JSR67_05355 [Proteobacteria bacterium]|nr:hypothetical protein [Pseudomonadota bacterium]
MQHAHIQRNQRVGDFEPWGLPAWDFDEFHGGELPRRLAAGGNRRVAWDVSGAPPFALRLTDGRACSYVCEQGAIRIEPGVRDDAATLVEIETRAWQQYVNGFRTVAGLVLAQSIRMLRGDMETWDIWAPALASLYTGQEIFDAHQPLLDAAGAPLDLRRSFTLDDDPQAMAHFLETAGFIVVRGALAHRRQELSREVDRLRAAAVENSPFSWWADNQTTGERFPYRLMFLSEYSELIRSLMDEDATVRQLAALARRDLVPLHDRGQGALTVLKPFGAGEKIGDSIAANLGWHTDCGLGGHCIMCPSINIGIHLDAAGPQSSQLWAMGGTHGKLTHTSLNRMLADAPNAVALDTEPGDVTIHFSCTNHAGPPPAGRGPRRTLYLPFYPKETLRLLGRFESFEQIQAGYGTGKLASLQATADKLTAG